MPNRGDWLAGIGTPLHETNSIFKRQVVHTECFSGKERGVCLWGRSSLPRTRLHRPPLLATGRYSPAPMCPGALLSTSQIVSRDQCQEGEVVILLEISTQHSPLWTGSTFARLIHAHRFPVTLGSSPGGRPHMQIFQGWPISNRSWMKLVDPYPRSIPSLMPPADPYLASALAGLLARMRFGRHRRAGLPPAQNRESADTPLSDERGRAL